MDPKAVRRMRNASLGRTLHVVRGGVDSIMTALEQVQEISVHEKLRLMEAIWDQMAREEGNWEVSQWHEEILNECARLIAEGETTFIDWENAKKRIKAAV